MQLEMRQLVAEEKNPPRLEFPSIVTLDLVKYTFELEAEPNGLTSERNLILSS